MPTPRGSIFLNPSSAPPATRVTFSGNGLDANTNLPVLIDSNHIADVDTDSGGSFSIQLSAPDLPAGTHQVCIAESYGLVCAGFTLDAAPASTPTPTSSPTVSPSPSPSGATLAQATVPTSGGTSPLALLTGPPFVFLPILGAIGLLAFLALYLWRARPALPIGEVTILHRAPPPRVMTGSSPAHKSDGPRFILMAAARVPLRLRPIFSSGIPASGGTGSWPCSRSRT